jgi:hypothetical protein
MLKPNIKYRVTLTGEEREVLQRLIQKGNTAGYRIRHAQILLALDEIPANEHWTDKTIGDAYGARQRAVGVLRKRFVEEGFDAALERNKEGNAAGHQDRRGSGGEDNRPDLQPATPGPQPVDSETPGRQGGGTGDTGQHL